MEKKKQENKMRRDQLNDEYLELLDKQRLYFKTVKDFKEVRTLHFKHLTEVKSTWTLIYHNSVKGVKHFVYTKNRFLSVE